MFEQWTETDDIDHVVSLEHLHFQETQHEQTEHGSYVYYISQVAIPWNV